MVILNRYKYIIISVLMIISILSINVIQPKAELIDSINLINNGDFKSGVTSWYSFVNSSITEYNGELCVELHSITDYVAFVQHNVDIIAGHKYYVSYNYMILSGDISHQGLRFDTPWSYYHLGVSYDDLTTGIWFKSTGILETSENYSKIYLGQGITNNQVHILYDKVMLIDLTTAYGAGNEPNILDSNAIYSDYFEGLKRQDIKPHDVTENAHKTVIQMIISTMLVPIEMLKTYKVGNQISLFDIFIGMIILFILTKTILKIGGRTSNDIR